MIAPKQTEEILCRLCMRMVVGLLGYFLCVCESWRGSMKHKPLTLNRRAGLEMLIDISAEPQTLNPKP